MKALKWRPKASDGSPKQGEVHARKRRKIASDDSKDAQEHPTISFLIELSEKLPRVLLDLIVKYIPVPIIGTFVRTLTKAEGSEMEINYPLILSGTDKYLAVMDCEGVRIQVWNPADWSFLYVLGSSPEDNDLKFESPSDGKFLRMWGSENLARPSSTAVYGEEIFVYGGKRISVFNHRNGNEIRSWTYPTFSDCLSGCSMCISEGELYLALEVGHGIMVFDIKTGTLLRKFGEQKLVMPGGILVRNEEVYVSDAESCRIYVYSQDGVYLRKWGSPGNGMSQLEEPGGMTTISDYLLVADCGNDRIQVFT